MQHSFDIQVAAKYGVDIAIFLHNLSFWIAHNKANKKNYHQGRYWTYNTLEAFTEIFPYWSKSQIQRLIIKIINHGLIIKSSKFNDNPYDHTPWYSLTDLGLQVSPLPLRRNRIDGEMKSSRRQDEIVSTTYTDIKPYIKPDIAIPEFLDKDLWEKFKEHRKKIKKPMTDHAIVLFLNKIIKFKEKGYNVHDLIEYSIECGYPSIYEPRKQLTVIKKEEIVRPKYRDFTQERLDREAQH
jgi:hypothetical protein